MDISAPDFEITAQQPLSKACLAIGLGSFQAAAQYVHQLPYKRNTDKGNLLIVLLDQCGTCSTKHAFLKQLAIENSFDSIHLVTCYFSMNAQNTKAVAKVLQSHGLDYLPEAHNYLTYEGKIFDYTKIGFTSEMYLHDILACHTVMPQDIGEQKVQLHKEYLSRWLEQSPQIQYTLNEIWQIREHCIEALATTN